MAEKYMATWGHKGFLVSLEKIVPFMDMSTAHSLKSEYHTDYSGAEAVNVRARDTQTITFKTRYLRAAGVDPKNQMRQWYDLLGMTYPMYIGGKQFGPPLLQLIKVEWGNFLHAPDGYIIGADATITLKGYVGDVLKITQKTFDSWTGKSYNDALNTKPSAQEKKNMKGGR